MRTHTITGKLAAGLCALGFASALQAGVPAATGSPITHPVFMCGTPETVQPSRPAFESIPTRPLALSEDGTLLFAVNTLANCLEIFDVRGDHIVPVSSVSVGVDPVAVALRTPTEVWVVNHLSDSVSIVDLRGTPHVAATLPVGDEPWDIVFADNGRGLAPSAPHDNRKNRAVITAAYRGQSHPQFRPRDLYRDGISNQHFREGEPIGRADLWVFDVNARGRPGLAGLINLFTASARALAVSPDGEAVYAASFKSGNRTLAIGVEFEDLLEGQWSSDGVGNPEPHLIVREEPDGLRDEHGRLFPRKKDFSLADNDLFVVDARTTLVAGNRANPAFNRAAITRTVTGLGTILFNVEAGRDRVYVSGIDSHNTIALQERLAGRFATNIIASLDLRDDFRVATTSLDALPHTGTASGALPAGMALAGDTLLVAAMGGQQVLRFRTADTDKAGAALTADGAYENHNGPVGLAVDERRQRFFAYTRFDNRIVAYPLGSAAAESQAALAMADGEPENRRQGRRYFYDATLTSGNGTVACATCHTFGGSDRLQWDLGQSGKPLEIVRLPYVMHPDPGLHDLKTTIRKIRLDRDPASLRPGDTVTLGGVAVPVVYQGNKAGFADLLAQGTLDLGSPGLAYLAGDDIEPRLSRFHLQEVDGAWALIDTPFFHPLKGPMLTPPLYGIADSGALHFRGDMQGLTHQDGKDCPQGDSVEERALKEFNAPCEGGQGSFEGLLGGKKLDDAQMQVLADFLLALTYPPNPIRPLDNAYVNDAGAKLFFEQKSLSDITDADKLLNKSPLIFRCQDCHSVDRAQRKFGTSTLMYSAPVLTLQDAKIPHLRFLYDRVGYFGWRPDGKEVTAVTAAGFNHGGYLDMNMFFLALVWILEKDPFNPNDQPYDNNYARLFEFLMGFDTNLFPMYGQQLTLTVPGRASAQADYAKGPAFRRFVAYLADAYLPQHADTAQCTVTVDLVRYNGSIERRVVPRDAVVSAAPAVLRAPEPAHISPARALKQLSVLRRETRLPLDFVCL